MTQRYMTDPNGTYLCRVVQIESKELGASSLCSIAYEIRLVLLSREYTRGKVKPRRGKAASVGAHFDGPAADGSGCAAHEIQLKSRW